MPSQSARTTQYFYADLATTDDLSTSHSGFAVVPKGQTPTVDDVAVADYVASGPNGKPALRLLIGPDLVPGDEQPVRYDVHARVLDNPEDEFELIGTITVTP